MHTYVKLAKSKVACKTVRGTTPYTIPRLPLVLHGSQIRLRPLIEYTMRRPHYHQKGIGC